MLSPAHSPQRFTFGRPVASTPCTLGADSRDLCVKRVWGGASKVDSASDFARGWGLHWCNSAFSRIFPHVLPIPATAFPPPLHHGQQEQGGAVAIWDSCTTIDWTASGVEDCGGSARGGMKKLGLAGAGAQKSATKAPHQAEASQKSGNIRLSHGERAKGHHWLGAERKQCACRACARGPEGLR